MNRALWKSKFISEGPVRWPCPRCKAIAMQIPNKTLLSEETVGSKARRNHREFSYDWIEGRFCCLLKCSACGEVAAIAGDYTVDQYPNEKNEPEYCQEYRVTYFERSPDIIAIPARVPPQIATEIRNAFQLYWNDAPASANRLRSAIEMLLTHLKVRRQGRTRSGTIERYSLHKRIELMRQTRPQLAEQLLAIKWLGNEGSHSSLINQQDVLDGLEILELSLEDLFDRRRDRVIKIVRKINRKKGPINRF